MKTVMQELIEYVDNPMKSNAISKLELVFYLKNTLLEKEKEQIMNAFEFGMSEGLSMENNTLGYDANSEKYYNQTYKQ
jgi:hypothetical protein